MNFFKKNWKYIVIFFIGMFIPYIITYTSINNTLFNINGNTSKIQKLEIENSILKSLNERHEMDRNGRDVHIRKLIDKNDSLSILIKKNQTVLKIYQDKKTQEINKINNFTEKELYDFFSNLK
jgi:hypothetical protein